MKPQIREAIGWIVYDSNEYITISWDRDAEPPTLKCGDPKASGLVLLKADILELKRFQVTELPLQNNSECHLNSTQPTDRTEYALSAKESEKLGPKTNKRKGQK
jgi:hypothetical protein